MPGKPVTPTLLFNIYRGATRVLSPVAWARVSAKLKRHGVAPERMQERLGHASLQRPPGRLIWFHAASVGESLSILTLIDRMGSRFPDLSFLITSGTATSAELVARRLPPQSRHQFAPLDAPGPVDRFLRAWRPDAAIFVESELWPNALVSSRASGVALALLNARLSERSVRGWKRVGKSAKFLLDQFSIILTQNRETADNLVSLGADPDRVRTGINLKSTSAPLPVDDATLSATRQALAGRPVWIASSTHAGEEETVLAAHKALLKQHPGLCLVLIPRHPERGDAVETLTKQAGLALARRSRGDRIAAGTSVYLADTLGETGTWYALSPIVFLGGSLKPIGGHNPFEPAQAGAGVITGPHVFNFSETFGPLIAAGGAVEVTGATGMAEAVGRWLEDATALDAARGAASGFVGTAQAGLDRIIDDLACALELGPEPGPGRTDA